MKTTLDIKDDLMRRAKRLALRKGQPLRALVEEGLQRVLAADQQRSTYQLPDRAVGDSRMPNPLEALSWPELRAEIYGEGRVVMAAAAPLSSTRPPTRPAGGRRKRS